MSGLQVDLNRIHISLKGVSANLVQEALSGLEDELTRRWQGMKALHGDVFANDIRLDAREISPDIAPREMRALLVDQIVSAVERAGRGGERV